METGAMAALATAAIDPAGQEASSQAYLASTTILEILLHSIGGALTLVLVTFCSRSLLFGRPHNQRDVLAMGQGLLNLLFLTVGITGVMILVRDNVVRAFAVLAAISLVRFRIRVDEKGLNSAMIFAILIGMANAVQQYALAWIAIAVYVILLLIAIPLMQLLKLSPSDYPVEEDPKLRKNTPSPEAIRSALINAYSEVSHLDAARQAPPRATVVAKGEVPPVP